MNQKDQIRYSDDFETVNDEKDCRVWAAGSERIDTGEFQCWNNLDDYMKYLETSPGIHYFHNEKFDGSFIIPWLFRHGYTCVDELKTTEEYQNNIFEYNSNPREFKKKHKDWTPIDRPVLARMSFSTLISALGQWYAITIKFPSGTTSTLWDSLKIFGMSVAKMPSAFGLEVEKGEIDYNLQRPKGWKLTEKEIDYLKRDCHIVALSLKFLFSQNLDKMTQGAMAYANFKQSIGGKSQFRTYFPDLNKTHPGVNVDAEIRGSYKGGYCIVHPEHLGEDVGRGIVMDKNSMYPSMMKFRPMPNGIPKLFHGEPDWNDSVYPLFIVQCRVCFQLKPGHLPTIQDKSRFSRFKPTEYLTSSVSYESDGSIHDTFVNLCLTNVDLKLLMDHYDIYEIHYYRGWKFASCTGVFDEFIDYWYQIKEQATIEKNPALRQLAKIMLNSCYGKLATNPNVCSKVPYWDEENQMMRFKTIVDKSRAPEYCPAAAFITAWARDEIIRLGQLYYDRLLYIDTDSLHLLGDELPSGMDIDKSRLGAWDLEMRFVKARYLRTKTYMEVTESGKNIIKCTGLPHSMHEMVNWDNFHFGLTLFGKLQHHTVPGGVVLKEVPFQLH